MVVLKNKKLKPIKIKGKNGIIDEIFTCSGNSKSIIQLKSILISKDVKEIDIQAFSYFENLEEVIFQHGTNIEIIGRHAFSNCYNLRKITIPKSVKKIDAHAFSLCENLEEVVFQDGTNIEVIGKYSFYGCKNLRKIIIPKSVKIIEERAFSECIKLEKLVLPDNIENIGMCAFERCENLKEIIIPKGVKMIESGTFSECKKLEKISLLGKIENIKVYAFAGCRQLKEFYIPETVEQIGMWAFRDCCGLKKIFMPGSIRKIDNQTFINCISLEELILGDGIEYIDVMAFYNCKKLKKVIIPGSVKRIGNNAFGLCYDLEEVFLNEGLEYLDLTAFCFCKNLKKIIIPSSVETVISIELINLQCVKNIEVYSREINTRFINDINYHSYKADDKLIEELCLKYPYIKKELLDLVNVKFKIGEYADSDINFEDEYLRFIQYCNNNIFSFNNSQTIKSSKEDKLSASDNLVDRFIPWYWMEQSNLNNMKEYDNLKSDVPSAVSKLITDDDLLLLEKLGIKKDEYGYWYNGDVISKLQVEDMKKLVKINDSNFNKK